MFQPTCNTTDLHLSNLVAMTHKRHRSHTAENILVSLPIAHGHVVRRISGRTYTLSHVEEFIGWKSRVSALRSEPGPGSEFGLTRLKGGERGRAGLTYSWVMRLIPNARGRLEGVWNVCVAGTRVLAYIMGYVGHAGGR